MAIRRTPIKTEDLYRLMADAFFSGDAGETVGQARERMFRGMTDEEHTALDAYVVKQREKYAQAPVVVEAEELTAKVTNAITDAIAN